MQLKAGTGEEFWTLCAKLTIKKKKDFLISIKHACYEKLLRDLEHS